MPSFSSHILSKEEAEEVALSFSPQKFPFEMPAPAQDFSQLHEHQPSGFRMNELIQAKTGIAEQQKQVREELAEQKALEKLKELQEAAYKEAYALGLDEGRKEAFNKHQEEIVSGVKNLLELTESLKKLKLELITYNEGQLVKLLYYMASRIAMTEIKENAEAVVPVLKTVTESSQSEEEMTVKISPKDFEFLQEIQKNLAQQVPQLANARFEKLESIRDGGCIVETNYGQIDATLEQRLERMMESVNSTVPKAKDKFEA